MNAVALLIASLAVWRVSRMITLEEGPFSAFAWLRGHVDARQQSWIGRGLGCLYCVSFWLALLAALVLQATIIEALGIAGGAVMLDRMTSR